MYEAALIAALEPPTSCAPAAVPRPCVIVASMPLPCGWMLQERCTGSSPAGALCKRASPPTARRFRPDIICRLFLLSSHFSSTPPPPPPLSSLMPAASVAPSSRRAEILHFLPESQQNLQSPRFRCHTLQVLQEESCFVTILIEC
jgi:hypothetical protein